MVYFEYFKVSMVYFLGFKVYFLILRLAGLFYFKASTVYFDDIEVGWYKIWKLTVQTCMCLCTSWKHRCTAHVPWLVHIPENTAPTPDTRNALSPRSSSENLTQ